MDFYSRFFYPGLKITIFSPGFVVPVGKPGLHGGYEPGVKTPSPPVLGAKIVKSHCLIVKFA